jgi:hypothetical protein
MIVTWINIAMNDLNESRDAILHDIMVYCSLQNVEKARKAWDNLLLRIDAELGNTWSNAWEEGHDEGYAKGYENGRDF